MEYIILIFVVNLASIELFAINTLNLTSDLLLDISTLVAMIESAFNAVFFPKGEDMASSVLLHHNMLSVYASLWIFGPAIVALTLVGRDRLVGRKT